MINGGSSANIKAKKLIKAYSRASEIKGTDCLSNIDKGHAEI